MQVTREDTKSVYVRIGSATGPRKCLTAPLHSTTGEILYSRDEQLGRWVTKVFDLVSREVLFSILLKIGCLPSLFNMVKSFHTNTKATVQYDGSCSEPFTIKRLSFSDGFGRPSTIRVRPDSDGRPKSEFGRIRTAVPNLSSAGFGRTGGFGRIRADGR